MAALVVPWAVADVREAALEAVARPAGETRESPERSEFPAFLQGKAEPTKPHVLNNRRVARRAAVLHPVAALRSPRSGAPEVAKLSTRTPERTDAIVLALEEREDEIGVPWVRVRLPVLPNNTTGWVPRQALGPYQVLRTRLVVSLDRFRAVLYRNGRPVFGAPVGIGRPKWPTPRGEFYIRNKLTDFRSAFYGPIAFGTSARSAVLTDWPAGGFVGIHGTNRPELLPGAISHGCIRMRNADIRRLARLMPPGTPLTIR